MPRQSIQNTGYWGASDIIKIYGSCSGLICFNNPTKSKIKIILKKTIFSNFSSTPIKYDCITCNDLYENLKLCDNSLQTTLKKSKYKRPLGQILIGTNKTITNARYIYSGILKPFSQEVTEFTSSYTAKILFPDTNLTYVFSNIYSDQETAFNILFEWIECPIRSY